MTTAPDQYKSRPTRYVPAEPNVHVISGAVSGLLENISENGLLLTTAEKLPRTGETFTDLRIETGRLSVRLPAAKVVRTTNGLASSVACAFSVSGQQALESLGGLIEPPPYVRDDLLRGFSKGSAKGLTHRQFAKFAMARGSDVLARCREFYYYIDGLQRAGAYQTLYRVTSTRGLDHRTTLYNPFTRREEEFICFDSNSYLGLHMHPRVIQATKAALEAFGYGSPSSQILSGTNRHLRELEETLCEFHGREAALVFSSGYAANVGTISALMGRKNDRVLADRFSHASLHDGARWAIGSRHEVFGHNDAEELGELLAEGTGQGGAQLIVSDGVFSMHGGLVNLPAIHREARRHNATLMIDEAHSTGVIGATGRGIEEHFGSQGCVDILMGTLSKAPGTTGGYVCGSRELVTYLRFFARSAMFSTALPAALCAGATEAFRIMMEDQEPLARLQENRDQLVTGLNQIGYSVPHAESAIVTVLIGNPDLVVEYSRRLYHQRIRCGAVAFPAVPSGRELLRFAVTSRHTPEDIERCVEALDSVDRSLGRER